MKLIILNAIMREVLYDLKMSLSSVSIFASSVSFSAQLDFKKLKPLSLGIISLKDKNIYIYFQIGPNSLLRNTFNGYSHTVFQPVLTHIPSSILIFGR